MPNLARDTISAHVQLSARQEKMPPFPNRYLFQDLGHRFFLQPSFSLGDRARLMQQVGFALCTRVATGDRLEAPRATRGQLSKQRGDSATHNAMLLQETACPCPGAMPPHIPSLLWSVCITRVTDKQSCL